MDVQEHVSCGRYHANPLLVTALFQLVSKVRYPSRNSPIANDLYLSSHRMWSRVVQVVSRACSHPSKMFRSRKEARDQGPSQGGRGHFQCKDSYLCQAWLWQEVYQGFRLQQDDVCLWNMDVLCLPCAHSETSQLQALLPNSSLQPPELQAVSTVLK